MMQLSVPNGLKNLSNIEGKMFQLTSARDQIRTAKSHKAQFFSFSLCDLHRTTKAQKNSGGKYQESVGESNLRFFTVFLDYRPKSK